MNNQVTAVNNREPEAPNRVGWVGIGLGVLGVASWWGVVLGLLVTGHSPTETIIRMGLQHAWLMLLLVGVSIGAMLVGTEGKLRCVLKGLGILWVGLLVVLVSPAAGGGIWSWGDGIRLELILVGWSFMLAMVVGLLPSRQGGMIAVVSLGAFVLLSVPITLNPAIQLLPFRWQTQVVAFLGALCPVLSVESALSQHAILWPQMTEMYHLTTWGQDIAFSPPGWWVVPGMGMVVGGVAWGIRAVTQK